MVVAPRRTATVVRLGFSRNGRHFHDESTLHTKYCGCEDKRGKGESTYETLLPLHVYSRAEGFQEVLDACRVGVGGWLAGGACRGPLPCWMMDLVRSPRQVV